MTQPGSPVGTIELRCFCSRSPLLAMAGRDEDGQPFVHIKIWKQKRLYGEFLVVSGATVRIRCRECLRWMVVSVKSDVEMKPSALPESIPVA